MSNSKSVKKSQDSLRRQTRKFLQKVEKKFGDDRGQVLLNILLGGGFAAYPSFDDAVKIHDALQSIGLTVYVSHIDSNDPRLCRDRRIARACPNGLWYIALWKEYPEELFRGDAGEGR